MLTYRSLVTELRNLKIDHSQPVIAHTSLSAFGEVQGGADSLLGALVTLSSTLVMPTFTYKTMLIPEVGPEGNGIVYGSGKDTNRMAEYFTPDMEADRLMGSIAEALRQQSKAGRSSHPILSFAGINAGWVLETQTLANPLAPIDILKGANGWVLLLGVDHTVNTSIHYAEKLAGRKQFIRWALTSRGVVECPGFPGCSDGFQAIAPQLESVTRKVQAGNALIQAVPLPDIFETVRARIAEDPLALLCSRSDCERCNAVRAAVHG